MRDPKLQLGIFRGHKHHSESNHTIFLFPQRTTTMVMSTIKFLSLLFLARVHAFVPHSTRTQRSFVSTAPKMSESSTAEPSDFASAMPSTVSPYERLGVPKEKLALGIDPEEVLQWLGTRQDILAIIQNDNPSFSSERAEEETDRLLMDMEIVNGWIKYLETKENNPELIEQALNNQEKSLLDQVSDFAPLVLGYLVFANVNKNFIQPKFESGEWEPIHLGGFFGGGGAETVSSAVDAATSGMV